MSHKDEGLKTRHRQYWKKIEADSVVLDPGIIAISWEDSTIRLHDGYTIGGRIFPMAPAPSLTVNVLTPLSGNGSVSSPISLNIAALANQVPVLANAPITGTGIIGNPLDIDTVALATELANAVPVAHDATLVGNGTAGAPLSVNWGLAPAPTIAHNGTLSGAGTPASPLAVVPNSLASLVAVSAISPITGDGKIATPLTLDVAALLPQLHNNVTVVTDGVTVTGSGTTANPLVAVPAVATVVTASPIVGNGTLASPIDINIVSAIAEISAAGGVPVVHNTSLTGNGTTASPLNVDWSQMPALNVQHDGSMTGQGTAGNPLSVNWTSAPAVNVQHDGTMTGYGTAGSPLSVNVLALASQVPVSVNATLSGNGTAGSPLSVVPAALASQIPVSAITPITGNGTLASPLTVDTPALIPALNNKVTVVTDGVTITGAGIVGNPLVAIPVPATTVVAASPLTGNGSIATPLDVNIASLIAEISAAGGVPVAHDGSMLGMGTTLSPLSVNWANMPALSVQHDTSMTGQGTAGNPLSVNWSQAPAINVNHDGTMIGSGTLASPLSVNTIALANLVPVTVGAGLTGNGTTASPIAPNPSVLGPALSGLVPVAVSAPLTGTGTAASPLDITNATGAARGVVQLATAAEGPAPADEVQATTPAYVESRIGTLVPAATGIVAGKVMLATSTEGAQPLNDSDAATPKYVADVVAAANHAPMTFTSSDGSILNAGAGQALDLTVNPAILGGGSSPAFPMPWGVAVVNNNGTGSSSIRAGYQTIGAGAGPGPYSANPGLGGFVHIAGEQVAQTTDGWHAWPMTATMAELRTPPLNGGVFDFSQGFFIFVDNDTATFTTELNFVGVLVRYNDGTDKTVMIGPNNFLGGFLPFGYGPPFTQSTLASMRRPDMKVGTPSNSGGFPVNIFHIGMDIADVIPAGAALISADLVVFWGTSTDSYGGCTQGWSASGSWFARQSGSKTLAQFLASAN